MKLTGKNLGKWGEEQAEKFLVENGVVILAKNIHTKYGEIDLLGIKDNCLLFIEVKTSQTRKYGFPEVSVNAKKRDHMSKAAQKYIQDHEDISNDWRIDVVSIEVDLQNNTEIKWFKNAVTE
jgi:putative endonuclease